MKHILIVDDSKTNIDDVKSLLNRKYKITAVDSGVQAIRFAEDNQCDLILIAINMSDTDGFEVMHRIRDNESYKDIPVMFMTDEHDPKTESRCIESGAVDFVIKPVVPAVMLSRISRILEMNDMKEKLANKLKEKIREVHDIKNKSNKDALTGLWNREYTENAVNSLVSHGRFGAFLMLDMDNFKAINDLYGHIEGDNTLKMFADTMRKHSSEDDVLCRLGGDEFVIFLNGVTSKKDVSVFAEKLINELCDKLDEKKLETNTSVSIGIVQIPEDGNDFKSAYNAADKALYYVKQNGKNSYHFFSEQNNAENSRAGNLVDIKYIKELISRTDPGRGVFQLDLERFYPVYNFIRRFTKRSGENVQTILFTAYTDKSVTNEPAAVESALEALEKAIFTSLRRADVSTRYSSRQIIVILLATDTNNGEKVAERILKNFQQIYDSSDVSIEYDIADMDN